MGFSPCGWICCEPAVDADSVEDIGIDRAPPAYLDPAFRAVLAGQQHEGKGT